MDIKEIVGLNTKYYRYKKGLTQEDFAALTNFKMAYISIIENGITNLTLNNIAVIAKCLEIKPELLFKEDTALEAQNLPKRVFMYKKEEL